MNTIEQKYAELSVKLLLGKLDKEDVCNDIDWHRYVELARKNVILIRVYEKLQNIGIGTKNHVLEEAFRLEKERVKKMTALIGKINSAFSDAGLKFVFFKSFQHYPDMGGDIDVLVKANDKVADSILAKEFNISALPKNIFLRVAKETNFILSKDASSIEVHHGRLGMAGEYFFQFMVENSRVLSVDGINVPVPSFEDQLLNQVVHRMYSHFYIRMSDFIDSIILIRSDNLNWAYVLKTAKDLGIKSGLSFYVKYINDIYKSLFSSGNVYFNKSYYRYQVLPMTIWLYLCKFASDIARAKLLNVVRFFLVPAIMSFRLAGNLFGKKSRFFGEV